MSTNTDTAKLPKHLKESEAVALFKKKNKGKFYKLHGGLFQSAMPDIIWIKPGGSVWFLEFKVVNGKALPWSKCRLGQHLTLIEMAGAGANVRYVVWSDALSDFCFLIPSDVHEGESTTLAD